MSDFVNVQPGRKLVGNLVTASLTPTSIGDPETLLYSVALKAASANTGTIFIYNSTGTNRIWQLAAGESISIDIAEARVILVAGSIASQQVYWMGVTQK